ncbi:MAG: AAA family ATPase [Candidatus Pacebacteria bacterium]|nr:AAA family ATPase [Candidatus Paceibacterota bacterium]
MARDYKKELEAATAAIVDTAHPKKIVVAGAGAGKTFAFGKLLDKLPTSPIERRLVITFLGGLKRDLEKDLGEKARVQTFHGYCFTLLKQSANIRTATGFTAEVRYVPRLGQLVRSDWVASKGVAAPAFLPSLRGLVKDAEADFFLARGLYYDAIGYDDSTVHIHRALDADHTLVPTHDLVIVDEVQDLNQAEISIIDLLSSGSDIVVAGDDDQALYGRLRDASEEHIRTIYGRADYLKRNLPFCMRCPSVVVNATNDIIAEAHNRGLLGNRIQKPYDPYPRPVDAQYPTIKVVQVTVQTPASNLFGKYILDTISRIPAEEITESREKGFPTVLIIGTKPYAGQVKTLLEASGYAVETKAAPEERMEDPFTREDALEVLSHDEHSNLGWRILLEADHPAGWEGWVAEAISTDTALYTLVEGSFRNAILAELKTWEPEEVEDPATIEELPIDRPTIRITSFEGAKGMSAQHVFVLGLEDGKFPARRNAINSLDVRRMIVALTRTRKQCYLLMARMGFTNGRRRLIRPSIFVEWIQATRRDVISINAASFRLVKRDET